ncbi:MAG: histidine phosphatase family protein, partial [Bdellovibrionota bacterium]
RGLSIEKKPALEEIHPGKLADIPANEAEKAFTRAFDPQDDPSRVRFLGGESLASLRDRVVPAWQQIVEDGSWKTLLLVAHGGVNRVILAHALGAGFESWARMEQDAACINIVDVSGNPSPRYVIRAVNFTPYNAVKDGIFETTMERLFRQYKGRA